MEKRKTLQSKILPLLFINWDLPNKLSSSWTIASLIMMAIKANTSVSETIWRFKSNQLENISVDFYSLKIFVMNLKVKMKKKSNNFSLSLLKGLKASSFLKIFNWKIKNVLAKNKIQIIFQWNLNHFQQLKKLLKVSILTNGLVQTCIGSI